VIAAILAHQGGWDEMLMVAGPIALFYYILRRANQKVEKAGAAADGDPDTADPSDGPELVDGSDVVHDGDIGTE
jgi:hypothetical protein